jgi:hypothetical protein
MSRVLFGAAAGIITAATMAAVFATLWFALPLQRERRDGG